MTGESGRVESPVAIVTYQLTVEQATDAAYRAVSGSSSYRRALTVGTVLYAALPLGVGLGALVWRLTLTPMAGWLAGVFTGLVCVCLARRSFACSYRRRLRAQIEAERARASGSSDVTVELYADSFVVHGRHPNLVAEIVTPWRYVTDIRTNGEDLELHSKCAVTVVHGSAFGSSARRREFGDLAERLWREGRQYSGEVSVAPGPAHDRPLASAMFAFSADDLADVACRVPTEQARVRRHLWVLFVFWAVLHGAAYVRWRNTAIGVSALLTAPVVILMVVRYRDLRRRLIRARYLRDGIACTGTCTFNLHADTLVALTNVANAWTEVAWPWSEATAIREDRGDLEILFPDSSWKVAVLRGRAFGDQQSRQAFYDLAMRLWRAQIRRESLGSVGSGAAR